MKTWVHTIFSLILSAIFYQYFGWKALFILVGGILIDIDHYLWYISKFKNFNLRDCYAYFTVELAKNRWNGILGSVLIFHTIEFFAVAIILSFYGHIGLLFLVGLIGHYLLDFIWHIHVPKMVLINHSLVWWLYKNKFKLCLNLG